jgi:cytochrome oxidase assembly protein ShyY1
MAQYAGGEEASAVPLLVEEVFGSYTLMRLWYLFCLFLIVPEGNIDEVNQGIAKGVPVGRAPVMRFQNEHASYVVT